MTDLIALMGRLVAPDGKILVPGVDDMVSVADAEERCVCCSSIFSGDVSSLYLLYSCLSRLHLLNRTLTHSCVRVQHHRRKA
jgi:hypothetical protein